MLKRGRKDGKKVGWGHLTSGFRTVKAKAGRICSVKVFSVCCYFIGVVGRT